MDSAFLTERMQSSFVCPFPCNDEAIRPQSSTTLPPAGDCVEWHIDTRDHPICSIIPLSWAKRYCRLNIWVGFVWARLALDGCIALERPLYQCPICDLLYKKHIFSWTEQNKKNTNIDKKSSPNWVTIWVPLHWRPSIFIYNGFCYLLLICCKFSQIRTNARIFGGALELPSCTR